MSSLEKSEKYVKIDERVHYRVLCAFVHSGCSFHGFARDLNFGSPDTIKRIIFWNILSGEHFKAKVINKATLAKIEEILKLNKQED